jgi:hypothetical protein
MADIGAKVSQLGLNVNDSADSQLLFNSSWPTLKIAYQGRMDINSLTTQTIVTHDLGYVPAFMVYRISGTTSTFDSQGIVYNGSGGGYIAANSSELKFYSLGVGSGTVSFYYYVFAQPIDTDYTAPINNENANVTGLIEEIDRDYGIKVAKEGKSVDSTDLRDFAIHSGTVSPSVHMIKNGATDLTATHGLGYEPLTLFYVNYGANGSPSYQSGWYYMLGGVGGVAYVRGYSNSTTCYVTEDPGMIGAGSKTATASILILKEPFNTVNGWVSTYTY